MGETDAQETVGEPGVTVDFASSADAVSFLFREHNRALVRYLSARLRSEQEAKEVAQEAYVRLLQLPNPGKASILRAYLFRTAANLAIDRLRHRTVRDRVEKQTQVIEGADIARQQHDDPVQLLVARERTEELLGFLLELPVKCQTVFSLHRFDGMPQRGVAAQLGFSERMVRRYVTYAMVYCQLRSEGMPADQVRERVTL